jgi:hypothetical protein
MAYYSNMLVLAGVFINERYFIYLLVNNAHRQTMGTWLEWLTNRIALFPYDRPLPVPFTMSALYDTITNRARNNKCTRWLTTPPRELSQSTTTLPVRGITGSPDPDGPSPDEATADPDENGGDNLHYMVCSLTSAPTGPGTCFACGSPDHKISALCPAVKAISQNAFATKQVIKTLQDTLGKDAPKTKHMHALLDPFTRDDDDSPPSKQSKA